MQDSNTSDVVAAVPVLFNIGEILIDRKTDRTSNHIAAVTTLLTCQGRVGQTRAVQGRTGQGRTGQGRTGQGRIEGGRTGRGRTRRERTGHGRNGDSRTGHRGRKGNQNVMKDLLKEIKSFSNGCDEDDNIKEKKTPKKTTTTKKKKLLLQKKKTTATKKKNCKLKIAAKKESKILSEESIYQDLTLTLKTTKRRSANSKL